MWLMTMTMEEIRLDVGHVISRDVALKEAIDAII